MASLPAAKDPESDEDDVPLLVPLDAEPPAEQVVVVQCAVTEKPSSTQAKEAQKPVPVTIITGCLGAGKTTLLNHILTSAHGKRIAVIENEFGQGLGIESAIARDGSDGSSLSEFLELANGCICCSVKSDLVATLEGLVERCGSKIDYIIIETSGMAHPGPVASCLWVDEMLESCLVLDGIVTVVDAKHFHTQSHTHDKHGKQQHEADMQVGFADRVLVNKVDLVEEGEEGLVALEARLRRMNGVAQLARTTRGKVDLDFILGLQTYATQGSRAMAMMMSGLEAMGGQGQGEGCSHGEGCGHSHEDEHEDEHEHNHHHEGSHNHHHEDKPNHEDNHRHEHNDEHEHSRGIGTVAWVEEGWEVLGEDAVTQWLGQWLWREEEGGRRGKDGVEVYRLKGVVGVRGGGALLLQGVHEAFEVTALRGEEGSEGRGCRVVVIGEGVEGQGPRLRQSFYDECCVHLEEA